MDSLTRSLLSYARESDENLAKVRKWRDDALDSMAAGNGSQLVSAQGNGVSFSVDTFGLKVSQWFDCLQQVIDAATRGVGSTSTRAIF